MKAQRSTFLLVAILACVALPSQAADRVRPGHWVGVTTMPGHGKANQSECVSQRQANAMNGDAKAVLAFLQTIIPPEICKLSNLTVNGAVIVYTSTCTGMAPSVITTTYHGDHSEASTSTGVKTEAHLVGPCK